MLESSLGLVPEVGGEREALQYTGATSLHQC